MATQRFREGGGENIKLDRLSPFPAAAAAAAAAVGRRKGFLAVKGEGEMRCPARFMPQ